MSMVKEFIKETLRWTVILTCYTILAWAGYYMLLGVFDVGSSEEYEVTYPY